MRLGETDLTKIRIPLTILDVDGNLVSGYTPAVHELQTSRSGPAWTDAAGTLVEIGAGAYYYQGVLADASLEGFLAVYINNASYRAMAWRPVVGASGLTIFPIMITSGGLLTPGCNPSAFAGELQMSLDGAAFVAATGTFGEIGGGYYYYSHNVANVDTPVIIKIAKAGFDEALAWGTAPDGISPTPPAPGGGGAGGISSSDEAQQQAKFYGSDIWYDVSKPDPNTGAPDYVVTSAGDWALVTGIEALRQSLLRRIITNPGEWKTKPNYGVGARQYVKGKNSASARAELEARIRSQFLQDSRVDSIDSVTITPLFDGGLQISVAVIAAGKLRNDLPLPVQMEVK